MSGSQPTAFNNIYSEAATLLLSHKTGSLKSRIYSSNNASKNSRSSPARVYALIMESLKHKDILNEVITKSEILTVEKKLNSTTTLLLLHDFLLLKPAKYSIALSAKHPLRAAILRHKARLNAEFTRARLHRGFGTTEAYLEAMKASDGEGTAARIPRWVRVNRLKTTLDGVLNTSPFDKFTAVETLEELFNSQRNSNVYHIDKHIPDLIAFPPSLTSVLTSHHLYANGGIILQDKASCLPAYILNPPPGAHVIDACAAPGNKTTHLAAIMASKGGCSGHGRGKITAFERDPRRSEILLQMVKKAGADIIVNIRKASDFLKSDPTTDPHLGFITHLLLDPSCSGSGITAREQLEDRINAFTPLDITTSGTQYPPSKKRKRTKLSVPELESENTPSLPSALDTTTAGSSEGLANRLKTLSSFQLLLLLHALAYPHAKRITYSTCSIYPEENEHVVAAALLSPAARARGWTMDSELSMMRGWTKRGIAEEIQKKANELLGRGETLEEGWAAKVSQGCVRCDDTEGAGGFLVACFVREGSEDGNEREAVQTAQQEDKGMNESEEEDGYEEEDEWRGFTDDDNDDGQRNGNECLDSTPQPNPDQAKEKKKKRRNIPLAKANQAHTRHKRSFKSKNSKKAKQ